MRNEETVLFRESHATSDFIAKRVKVKSLQFTTTESTDQIELSTIFNALSALKNTCYLYLNHLVTKQADGQHGVKR